MPTPPDRLRIALVADQHLTRAGLRMTLEMHPDLHVAAEAATAAEAVHAASEADVVLVDTVEPCSDTRALTAAVKHAHPSTALLVVASRLCPGSHRVLDVGASGVLLKSARPEQLAGAVRSVAAGYAVLPAPMVGELRSSGGFAEESRQPDGHRPAQFRLASLTSRERDVLKCLADGASNGEAAHQLHLSEGTVKSHVQHLLHKLGVRDRMQAVVFAYRSGFADVRPRPDPAEHPPSAVRAS
ncbi:LuxR C-terminal-related transcriptional regulator [Kitasatospora sp. NBC_01539]|uniref:LuxR C-terminal-related transcriptional regulator n=1 Tax=Kitasatospora sp. NBC_01539 TaxID=2903577 RepID=UPI0038602E12